VRNSRHQEVRNPETPTRGMVTVTGNGHMDQGSARRAEAHRESGNRDSRGHKHYVIESAEIAI
jgi:hypothetical protein